MNIIHTIEVEQPKIEVNEKRNVKVLYIEADEDHVALQGKNAKRADRYKPQKIAMPRLVYVHEGIDHENRNCR